MPDLTVAAGVVSALMQLAWSKGASRRALAEQSGIDRRELRDPDSRIPFNRFVALMRAGQELCHDPALALHFGESTETNEMSIGCLIGGFSVTLGDGFDLMNRYTRLGFEVDGAEGDNRFQLTRRAGQLWMIDTRINSHDFPELTEYTFARMVSMSRRRLGEHFAKEVHVTHAEPGYREEYDRIFRVPVFFDSDENALLLTDGWQTRRSPSASRSTLRILSAHAELQLEKLEGMESTKDRVESLVMPILHTGDVSMEKIAGELGLSRQTLFRKLKAEGVSYRGVLDELRHRMALHYLCGQKLSIKRTAYLVGFSEPAAFSRAFKRWTGSSPRKYVSQCASSV